jgi:hypothetical protein
LADPTDRAFVRIVQAWVGLTGQALEGLTVQVAADRIARESADLIVPISAGPIVPTREGPAARASIGRIVRPLARIAPARIGVRKTPNVGSRVRNSAPVRSRRRDRHNGRGSKPVRGSNSARGHSSNARVHSNSRLALVKEAARDRINARVRKERGRR